MALIGVRILRESPRKVIYVHTRIEGRGDFTIWIESKDGTYYEQAPTPNFDAQDLQEAKWDLRHGRPNPLAREVALYPQTVLDPQSLTKGKNK